MSAGAAARDSEQGAADRGFAVVVVALALLYLWVPGVSPSFVSPNELSRILLTRAVVEEGSFAIDRGVERQGETWSDLAQYAGHFFSDKAPGLSLVAVPVYALLQPLGARAWSDVQVIYACRLLTVTLPALLFVLWRYRRAATDRARLLWLAAGAGSLLFAQAFSFTGHLPAALLLLIAFERLRAASRAPGGELSTGALLGAAVAFDYTAALPAAIWVIFGLARERSLGVWAARVAGAALPLALLAGYHVACFGGPFELAYRHLVAPAHRAHRELGFFGATLPDPAALWQLTFGGQRGLFLHAPFLLAAVPAAWRLLRAGSGCRAEAATLGSAVVALVVFNAALVDWQGGWSLGPRYLALAVPALVWLIEHDSRAGCSAWLAAAAGWSVLLHVLAVATFPLAPFGSELRFPALELAAFLLGRNLVSWNWAFLVGWRGVATLAPLALALGGLLFAARRRAGVAWALAGALALLVVGWSLAASRDDPAEKLLETFPARIGYRLQVASP